MYSIIFISDYFTYGYVYLMKYKSKPFERFKEYKNKVEKKPWMSIKILQLDKDDENMSQEIQDYLKENIIIS